MNALRAALGGRRVVSVVRAATAADAVEHVHVLARLGALDLVAVEITFTTPDAAAAIAQAAAVPGAVVGAGTVLRDEQASAAAAAGAGFLVAPVAADAVLSPPAGVLGVPGVATPNELHCAVLAGAVAAKVFPVAAFGGPSYLRHLRVVSGVPLMASGGIAICEVRTYLEAGAEAVALGALTSAAGVEQAVAALREQLSSVPVR